LSPDQTSVTAQTLTSTKTERQCKLADGVFGDVRRHFADFLGHETHRTAVGRSFERQVFRNCASSALRVPKDMNEIGGAREARERHPFRQGLEQLEIVRRCVFDMDGEARADSQLD